MIKRSFTLLFFVVAMSSVADDSFEQEQRDRALVRAIVFQENEHVEQALKNGASINARIGGVSPLFWALSRVVRQTVAREMEAGVIKRAARQEFGRTGDEMMVQGLVGTSLAAALWYGASLGLDRYPLSSYAQGGIMVSLGALLLVSLQRAAHGLMVKWQRSKSVPLEVDVSLMELLLAQPGVDVLCTTVEQHSLLDAVALYRKDVASSCKVTHATLNRLEGLITERIKQVKSQMAQEEQVAQDKRVDLVQIETIVSDEKDVADTSFGLNSDEQ